MVVAEVVVAVVVVVVVVVVEVAKEKGLAGGVEELVGAVAVLLELLDDGDNPNARMAACKSAFCGRLEGVGALVMVGEVVGDLEDVDIVAVVRVVCRTTGGSER